MKFLELTEWQSKNAIFVVPEEIRTMRRLSPDDINTERTRVDTGTDVFLVEETPAEIFQMISRL